MGTHYAGTEDEVRALNCYIKLMRASDAVAHSINEHLRNEGLTISQFGVLEVLYHVGPMAVGQLGARILRTSGNMTMVVDNLVKRGLICRQRLSEDRRRVDIRLSDEGKALIEDIWPEHLSGIMQAFSALDSEEQEELDRLCRKLGLAQAR